MTNGNFPNNDQAIIIDAIDGIGIKDYLIALTSLIAATGIRFISGIANNRICVCLNSKKSADDLVESNKVIKIQENILTIRPLITRYKKVILFNVCPVIPNYIVGEELLEYGVKPMSSITFMKTGVDEPGFTHIMSFRRQLYVTPEGEKKLPESFQVNFEDTSYWIYISTDISKCFSCNNLGHFAKNCPNSRDVNL